MTDIEKLETLRKLEKLQKDYSLGLNYIKNSNNSKSLEQQYIERLKELTISEYSETLIDRDDDKPPLLFVFGKDVNGRLVYIKLKIKGEIKKKVLCLSFHYAKYDMAFPYK